jgi:hypothetical protein
MTARGSCRVCGDKAPGIPCYKCFLLLLDRDNKNLSDDVRMKAAEELGERGRMKDG